MVNQCWADVVDGGPALIKHWVDVSCLLGLDVRFESRSEMLIVAVDPCHRYSNEAEGAN